MPFGPDTNNSAPVEHPQPGLCAGSDGRGTHRHRRGQARRASGQDRRSVGSLRGPASDRSGAGLQSGRCAHRQSPPEPSMTAALTVAAPVFAAAAKTSSSGAFIYLLLIVGVGFYFLIYRPQQRKAKALREQSNTDRKSTRLNSSHLGTSY